MEPSTIRRCRAVLMTALLALATATAATACEPGSTTVAWKAGKTHGAIIETTAGRASLGIYRSPRKFLYEVYKAAGIRAVQDVIWAVGQPPSVTKTFTYRGRSITTSFGTAALRSKAHDLIYRDPSDLRGALVDAQVSHTCLALTLISYGKPAANWTHKQVGCQVGALR